MPTHIKLHGQYICRLPEYRAWQSMRDRCHNHKSQDYSWYGARGITVCERWRISFLAFYEDMGPRPSPKHSIDRYPNHSGNYEKTNCRWATMTEQNRNRRDNYLITYQGRTMCLKEWSIAIVINYDTLWNRVNRGWSIERAFSTPVRPIHDHT
jgi:hypothetical protein